MLSDSIGRVKVPIRAAYGTDPRQVEKILVDIANAHPLVITRSPSIDQPWVLFKAFGESALMFELRAFITDIDCKMVVLSDINYSIAEAFHKAGIIIPFPQSDLHLRSSDISDLNPIS
jgi:small-conductance mechanosensitive channel